MIVFSGTILTDRCLFVTSRPTGPGYEILVPSGCRLLPGIKLRTRHYGQGSYPVGHLQRSWRRGQNWLAQFAIAETCDESKEFARRIEEFEIRHLSVGYDPKPSGVIRIQPWSKVTFDGRTYAAGPDHVDLVTDYIVSEVSLAKSPVDRSCEIFHVRRLPGATPSQSQSRSGRNERVTSVRQAGVVRPVVPVAPAIRFA